MITPQDRPVARAVRGDHEPIGRRAEELGRVRRGGLGHAHDRSAAAGGQPIGAEG